MTTVLRCAIGRCGVGVPLEAVRMVVRASEVIAPVGGKSSVIGLLNVRGRVVPVVDWDGSAQVRERVVIVEDADGEWLGIGVDGGEEVVQVSESPEGCWTASDGAVLTRLDPDRLVVPATNG